MGRFNPYNIKLSEHAIERAWERGRVDRSQLIYLANKALEEGINATLDETMRPLIKNRLEKHQPSGVYLLDGYVYIFKDDTLVTFMPLSFLADQF